MASAALLCLLLAPVAGAHTSSPTLGGQRPDETATQPATRGRPSPLSGASCRPTPPRPAPNAGRRPMRARTITSFARQRLRFRLAPRSPSGSQAQPTRPRQLVRQPTTACIALRDSSANNCGHMSDIALSSKGMSLATWHPRGAGWDLRARLRPMLQVQLHDPDLAVAQARPRGASSAAAKLTRALISPACCTRLRSK